MSSAPRHLFSSDPNARGCHQNVREHAAEEACKARERYRQATEDAQRKKPRETAASRQVPAGAEQVTSSSEPRKVHARSSHPVIPSFNSGLDPDGGLGSLLADPPMAVFADATLNHMMPAEIGAAQAGKPKGKKVRKGCTCSAFLCNLPRAYTRSSLIDEFGEKGFRKGKDISLSRLRIPRRGPEERFDVFVCFKRPATMKSFVETFDGKSMDLCRKDATPEDVVFVKVFAEGECPENDTEAAAEEEHGYRTYNSAGSVAMEALAVKAAPSAPDVDQIPMPMAFST